MDYKEIKFNKYLMKYLFKPSKLFKVIIPHPPRLVIPKLFDYLFKPVYFSKPSLL